MALVAGSYERFIWGFSLKTLKPLSGQNPTAPDGAQDHEGGGIRGHVLKPIFSYPSHAGSIKCVAVSGPVAVSGGSDDAVKIYDLSSCAEVGSLTDQGGAVTAVAFYEPPALPFPRNLVTGSDAGVVSIYDADPFVHLKSVRRVHRKGAGVADLALHPSGRLALTVGRGDASLAMVNLVRGRRSFACRLEKEASVLRYGLGDGDVFFMAAEETVSVHNSEDARLVAELVGQKKVLCVAPAENGVLLTGGEDRNVTAWDISSGKIAYCIEGAHSARVKGLVVLGSRSSDQSSDAPYLLASASSDGVIRLWDIRMVSKKNQNYLAEANTKSRLTCLAGSSIKSYYLHLAYHYVQELAYGDDLTAAFMRVIERLTCSPVEAAGGIDHERTIQGQTIRCVVLMTWADGLSSSFFEDRVKDFYNLDRSQLLGLTTAFWCFSIFIYVMIHTKFLYVSREVLFVHTFALATIMLWGTGW